MDVEIIGVSKTLENTVIELDDQEKTIDAESENDHLIEIRRSLLLRGTQISDLDIRNALVKCTACGQQINHHDPSKIRRHRRLGVITCKECYSFYNSGEFTKGEDGYYNYCTWCGNGGKLFICDYCPNVFCNPCIRRNFGRSEVAEVEKEGWKCFCCDSVKLKPKVMFCNRVLDYGRRALARMEKKSQNVNAINKKGFSQNWIKEILEETDLLSTTFQKKLIKLRDIDKSGSKSVKHIVKKIEQVINDHKLELKYMMRALSQQYNAYMASNYNSEEVTVNNELKTEKTGNKLDFLDVKADPIENSNSSCNLAISYNDEVVGETKKDANDKSSVRSNNESNEKDGNILHDNESKSLAENRVNDKCNEKDENVLYDHDSDSLTKNIAADTVSDLSKNLNGNILENHKSEIEAQEEPKTENKENVLAKLSLLEEFENSESPEPSAEETESKIKVGIVLSTSETESKIEKDSGQKSADNKGCSLFTNEDSIDDFHIESAVRRRLDFTDSSSGSSSSISLGSIKKGFKSKKKRVRNTERKTDDKGISLDGNKTETSTKKNKGDEQKSSTVSIDDPKLKLPVSIVLHDCKNMLQNDQNTVKISDIDELEKIVDNLHKFSEKRTKRKVAKNDEKKVKSKSNSNSKKSKNENDGDSSSSICFSSEEEEEKIERKKIFFAKNIDSNILAKNELMNSESSSQESSSDSDVVVKKKKSSSKVKKETDSSDNDFQPTKRKKYDKLLHKRLLSADESDSKENKLETGRKKQVKRKIGQSEENKEHSDTSHTTTSDSDASNRKKKDKTKPKKRRRIKNLDSSSDENVKSDKEELNSQGTPLGKGRKNIKKIISQKKLAVETKEAQELEKERKKRIQERQRLYNKIQDISEDGKEVITRKFVLEVDQSSKEEVVEIHPDLVQKLKPHQVNGVKFIWECTIESLKDLDKPGSGCILAHCMGLGKSLQVIAFLHTCFTNRYVKEEIKTAMIICPFNTALNWENEFEVWLSDVEGDIKVHQLATAKTNFLRLDIISWWQKEGGVLIVSYDLFRRLAAAKISGLKKEKRKKLHELLIDPGPDVVVCDEGHILKNESSAISKAVSLLRSSRRIVLTGTPLQNNLKEYHCMLTFVKPNLLGTAKEFRNRFVNPIINGQYGDSEERDVKLMKKRIHILHKLLDGCVQRCDYSALAKFLPPKHEFVINVKMSDVQIKMYQCYLDKLSNLRNDSKLSGTTLFTDFTALRCIWTHPYLCEMSFKRAELRRLFQDDDDDMEDFINDSSEESSAKSSSDSGSDKKSSGDEVIKSYKTRSRSAKAGSEDEVIELEEKQEEKQWYHEFISGEDKHKVELSGKMVLLIDILKECESIGDKILVFSQSLLTLDLIEDILGYLHDQSEQTDTEQTNTEQTTTTDEKPELPNLRGTWLKGSDYFRMDGSTSAEYRKSFIDMFNDLNNYRARLFLISTRAGSLGTNLVGANRVIIMDTSWNPSHDVQAIFRVYRFGQVKPVYIYRFLAQGTMEEKIYERQVTKLSLSIRVVDEQQIDRHFSADDLAALYTFTPDTTTDRPTPMIPKDRLLAEMLIKNKDCIISYHEHDSLLQNQTEEDLTEEERKTAWAEYENEREGRPMDTEFSVEDIKIDYEEPDFTQATYQGNLIPDLATIVNKITLSLTKKHMPHTIGFYKQLLVCLGTVRAVFQGKQVKLLRMKQEFFKRGSVPESVNKYLGEVNNILLSLNNYMTRVSQAILNAEKAEKFGPNANHPRAQNPNVRPPNSQFAQHMGNIAFRQANIRSFSAANIRTSAPGNPRFIPASNIRSFPGNVRYFQVPFSREMPQNTGTQKTPFNIMQEKLAKVLNPQMQKNRDPSPVITEADEYVLPNAKKPDTQNAAQSGSSSVVIEEIE